MQHLFSNMDRLIIKTLFCLIILFPFLTFGTETDTTIILLNKNEKYQISVDYCPGAGYYWTLSDTTDKSVIALIERKSQVKEGSGPKGGTYTELFVFQATGNGEKTMTLEFMYLRETRQIKVLIFKVTDPGLK